MQARKVGEVKNKFHEATKNTKLCTLWKIYYAAFLMRMRHKIGYTQWIKLYLIKKWLQHAHTCHLAGICTISVVSKSKYICFIQRCFIEAVKFYGLSILR